MNEHAVASLLSLLIEIRDSLHSIESNLDTILPTSSMDFRMYWTKLKRDRVDPYS